MWLSFAQIQDLRAKGQLVFTGEHRGDGLLLSIGGAYCRFASTEKDEPVPIVNAAAVATLYGPGIVDWRELALAPGEIVLAHCAEELHLPMNVLGLMSTLSHVARLGLAAHAGSFVVEPGFQGWLTFELINHTPRTLLIPRGTSLAKLKLAFATPGEGDLMYYGNAGQLGSRLPEELEGRGDV